ncbi:MAG: putative oxidoreductase [Solirubrobacterales bacterium]|nr:putative oxidoreductase [Solirubrobacterales bacterium]
MLRWGLVSTANINDAVLGTTNPPADRFVAVGSRDLVRAQAYAQDKGIPRAHGSYEDLFADPDVDAVYVSLPNGMHTEWAIKALEAGKHVLCEKPFDRDPAAVARAFDVAEARGLVLAEAFMWRHHPQVDRAVQLLADGAIGNVRLLKASFSFVLDDPANVRLFRGLDGGSLMDVGCYCVSGLRTLAGAEPMRVQAERVDGGDGVDVRLVATLRFPGDVVATLDCGFDIAPRAELEAIGDGGTLKLLDPWHGTDPVIELRRAGGPEDRKFEGEPERIRVDAPDKYLLELEDFEAAVRGERPPRIGRDDAVAQATTIAALYRAADHAASTPESIP